jgi:hypothetical protein
MRASEAGLVCGWGHDDELVGAQIAEEVPRIEHTRLIADRPTRLSMLRGDHVLEAHVLDNVLLEKPDNNRVTKENPNDVAAENILAQTKIRFRWLERVRWRMRGSGERYGGEDAPGDEIGDADARHRRIGCL